MDVTILSRLMEHIPVGVITQEQGKIVYMNPAGKAILGVIRVHEVIGGSIIDFVHKDDHVQFERDWQGLNQHSVIKIKDVRLTRLDEQIVDVELTIIKVDQAEEKQIIFMEDRTILKRSQNLLEQSDNLLVLGELAAGIAHEIRNPLTSLKGFLQLMVAGSNVNHTYSEIMLVEIERINLIVNELLTLVKPKQLEWKEVQLVQLVDTVITLLSPQAILANVQIITHYTKCVNQLVIMGESNKLKQVFINLIKNAIEAMPKGGKVIVLMDRHETHVQVNVMDQGKGIPKEELSKIGEAFHSTKENGMGLGLMMSKKIIEQHGGTIRIQSEEGKGTIVEVNFPI